MNSNVFCRRLLGAMTLATAMAFVLGSQVSSAHAQTGVSALNVTVFKLPRVPAKPAAGAIVKVMYANGNFSGFATVTNQFGKGSITGIPASTVGRYAFFVRVTHQGKTIDHYYGNGLFPSRPGARYNQAIFVP